ncbi:YozQ family protein [Lederbergia citrea]|uniref:YozQ family protein n=1 Tax=Lederbergia citrea TaxID=2833581 RepID=A0A942Z292_9BACI|nr:YozQ family protein [Lederbergia citrea]MBS4176499.1 YozQ family protein [Lederbergia citrea]MBS4203060.1 YozQ family protein [Lederbergia citrea]MBS4222268.1 YozQ family protein [Lederbergia citrea]
MENKNNENKKDSLNLAGRTYEVEDYNRKDTLSAGLATTHEQVSDAYMEGEIGAVIDDVKGTDIELNEKE